MSYFKFNGKKYEYVDMLPNQTRVNERRVEVALGFDFLDKMKGKNVLEVGNVMRHYKDRGSYKHDVVDLFETNPNFPEIINEDILTWKPCKRYDATLSISTLEHTNNPLFAINNIVSYSNNVLITIPFGYNRVDEVFDAFPDLLFMKRINENNEWKEATGKEVEGAKYGSPFKFANALMVLKR